METLRNQQCAGEGEGFIRLSTDEVREGLVDIMRRVLVEGERILLQQAGEEVAAIIPVEEFNRLGYLMQGLKPSQYLPEEEAYYEHERGIHCLYADDLQKYFADILEEVRSEGELFGFLPPANLGGRDVDIFVPVAILMSPDRFWIPEYMIAEKRDRDERGS
ncbi:type II toxin-antitoxin system Phd/YefM family antitoxin [Kamptonema formosum]|uniref:type II toxin-antitoxin system Phd/YefM family antitoxin n=1 Tax=Kamptonema formosum TaxID=331992 RepID=UPI000374FF36|nr:type II toxin-antitoxin system Phd/YefM family antitoxin [Oscillatoria sp. PCC 10802]